MENNNITTTEETTMNPSNEMKQRLGSKYIGEGVTLTDLISNRTFKIHAVKKDGFTIVEQVSLGTGEQSPLSYDEFLDKFNKSLIDVAGYGHTSDDQILLNQVIRDIMSGHTLSEKDSIIAERENSIAERENAIAEKENSINDLVTEEAEFKSGGILGKVVSNKLGVVKEVRNPFGKIVSEVLVGDKKYRRNTVYKTYNSVDGNELLMKGDADNIHIMKNGGIANIYAGKTPEQVWGEWNEAERTHFLKDHYFPHFNEAKTGKEQDVVMSFRLKGYSDLPTNLKDKIQGHIYAGSYGLGGGIEGEDKAKEIIDNEIFADQTSLVEKLLSDGTISTDAIKNYYQYPKHIGTHTDFAGGNNEQKEAEIERLKAILIDEPSISPLSVQEINTEIAELENLEAEPQDIKEWHLVSDWLADELHKQGEPTIDSEYGAWWGKTDGKETSNVIKSVVESINLDKYKSENASSSEDGYKGYKNKETWIAKKHIDNSPSFAPYWNERAASVATASEKDENGSKKDNAIATLSKELKEYYADGSPLAESENIYSELLNYALVEVDWNSIAGELLKEKMNYGGYMEQGGGIPNNYEGKTPEQVWSMWTPKQRLQFMVDHQNELDTKKDVLVKQIIGDWIKEEYKDLPNSMVESLELHVRAGQYKTGGGVGSKGREFNYVKLIPQANGLEIKLTKEGQEKVKEDGLTYQNAEDYFEDVVGNSDYAYWDDLGKAGLGMTNAEGITENYYPMEEEHSDDGKIYWFPDYQVKFWGDILSEEGSVFFVEAPKMKQGGKVDITSNYYRFRQHSPKGVSECATPEWAQHVAAATKDGAKITTCKKSGKWFVQSILIPREGVKSAEAKRMANEIKSKFDRKKKALGGVAETCTDEEIEKTKNGYIAMIESSESESDKNRYKQLLKDLD